MNNIFTPEFAIGLIVGMGIMVAFIRFKEWQFANHAKDEVGE